MQTQCLIDSQKSRSTLLEPHLRPTALYEDVQTLPDQQRGIQYDQSVAQRQDIVGRADLEKGSDCALCIRSATALLQAYIHTIIPALYFPKKQN